MDVLHAISKAEADLAKTLEELELARELAVSLEADSKKISIELAGLRAFATRNGLAGESAAPQSVGNDADVVPISANIDLHGEDKRLELVLMSRTDAVLAVMASVGEPMDRARIHEGFHDGGRFDTIDDISLTLSGLKRSGRVEKLGHGLWQPTPTATAELG